MKSDAWREQGCMVGAATPGENGVVVSESEKSTRWEEIEG